MVNHFSGFFTKKLAYMWGKEGPRSVIVEPITMLSERSYRHRPTGRDVSPRLS